MIRWDLPIERVYGDGKIVPAEVLKVLDNGNAVLIWSDGDFNTAGIHNPNTPKFRNVPPTTREFWLHISAEDSTDITVAIGSPTLLGIKCDCEIIHVVEVLP